MLHDISYSETYIMMNKESKYVNSTNTNFVPFTQLLHIL